jgi:transcriptional regulator with XRE-family HTH domain
LTYANLRRSFERMPITARNPHGVWHELRVMRTKDGRRLTDLAASCDPPMSLSYLSDLERGRQMPSADATRRLAAALNVPVSVLERHRHVDSDGNEVALRELIRQIVREELAAAGAA